jgi:hypothetical protein
MSQASELLESLRPGASSEPVATATLEAAPIARVSASETERMVREVLARARPTLGTDGPSPLESASADYHQLRIDNMVLADELRAALIERDVASGDGDRMRAALVEVSAKADAHVKALATLRAEMLVAGRLIVEVISKVDKQLDPAPEAVQAFRPSPLRTPE